MSEELEKVAPIPSEQSPEPPNFKGNSDAENKPNPPLVPPAEHGPSDSAHPNEKENKIEKWEIFERYIRVAEFIAFIAAIITAVFIGYQWHEMVKASKTAEEQLNVMKGQLDEMRDTRTQDERAWVFVEPIADNSFMYTADGATITMNYKNVGKTPALIVHTYDSAEVDQKNIPAHDFFGIQTSLVLIPNQEGHMVIALPNQIAAAILKNIKIYIYGTVFYRDINGESHWSQFCFCFDKNGTVMQSQNFHNSCDDLESNQTNK